MEESHAKGSRNPLTMVVDLPGMTPVSAGQALTWMGLEGRREVEAIPFGPGDVSVGCETELQAATLGRREQVDLPLAIEKSSFYANMRKRVASGEITRRAVSDLESYLNQEGESVWENSWVRFPHNVLSEKSREALSVDLRYDREDEGLGPRSDQTRYLFEQAGEKWVRVPISYLLKLALVDFADTALRPSTALNATARRLTENFLNDNTSPETISLYLSWSGESGRAGREAAGEAALRFLLTQLLLAYANKKFLLERLGQRALAYHSALPPVRQRKLNDCIPDSFYRELFMSPCLSGWKRGEEKHDYMGLCHRVLSRSQLNTLPKLKEAGIIRNNLVVLPNLSNTSLSNNGTHVSMGSRVLTDALATGFNAKAASGEKYLADLATKICEHFLPLFVGTYTAAPYRLSFADFHPESVMGFLPHELHYTHLRMIWRRWKGKAHLRILGKSMTPFGPRGLDESMALLFRLKGDYIKDFRLLDYLVSLLSTHEAPALDGKTGNWARLKEDLGRSGVFDKSMATYLLWRQREHASAGYAGFEARYYSIFESFHRDMAAAIDLQQLVSFLAHWLIFSGRIDHSDIPDTPFAESERRQVFFGAAIGLPTFFIRKDSGNRLLHRLAGNATGQRASSRYSDSIRIETREYLLGLLDFMEGEAAQVVEALGMEEALRDLRRRLVSPSEYSAEGRLVRGVLGQGRKASPIDYDAYEFNARSERYYREGLKQKQLEEALAELDGSSYASSSEQRRLTAEKLAREEISLGEICALMIRLVETIHHKKELEKVGTATGDGATAASVY